MSAALIAQLIVALGPVAFEVIQKLITLWGKPELTEAEVMTFCQTSQKSYDDYIAEASKTKPAVTG